MSFADWSYAIQCKRRAHVAAWRDYWTTLPELYAFEAQHLWSAVSQHTTTAIHFRVRDSV